MTEGSSTWTGDQALLHQGLVVYLWSSHQHGVALILQVWNEKHFVPFVLSECGTAEGRAAVDTAAAVLMVVLAGKGQPKQDV